MDLDRQYPHLGALIHDVHGLSLQQLAERAPTRQPCDFFDLERLLAYAQVVAEKAFYGSRCMSPVLPAA